MKNYDNFSHVGDSQSAAGMLLALFNAMNEWQGVLFLIREFSRLFVVSNMFICKQNNRWLQGDMTESILRVMSEPESCPSQTFLLFVLR